MHRAWCECPALAASRRVRFPCQGRPVPAARSPWQRPRRRLPRRPVTGKATRGQSYLLQSETVCRRWPDGPAFSTIHGGHASVNGTLAIGACRRTAEGIQSPNHVRLDRICFPTHHPLLMKIHLVDGTYELFRNHFGAPPRQAPDGRQVGATLGLLRSLYALVTSAGVTHVAVAFDHVIESFRNGLYAG